MDYVERIRQITPKDLLALGVDDVAYIRPVIREDQQLYAVFAADGREIVALPSRNLAEALIRQHDLDPVTLH